MSVANRLTTLLRFLAPFVDICTQQKVKVKSLYFTLVDRNSHLINKSDANSMVISPQIHHTSLISSQTGMGHIVVIFVCKTTLHYKSQQNYTA